MDALQGLIDTEKQVLNTVAAFRMPASYDTLTALLVGDNKLFANESDLVGVLRNLGDRGLLGWDRTANRYDLHPIVRSVTWGGVDREKQSDIYDGLQRHFQAMPYVDN